MANRRQAKKNAAAAVNKEAAKKEVKTTVAEETAEKVTAVEKVAEKAAEKAAEVKEAVKEKVAEVKETTKAAKAETAEKAEPKKTPGRKAAVKEEFVLEFAGKQITQEEIKKKVKENWTKVQKNKIKDIKTIKVFLQPENSCAYYTINDEGNDSYKIEL
ncbi:MAG: DUF6465 family protein [Lachnospiraceae bacterium]|nr:DUF6465 family protein [Lachnospiraceae bacterium]